MKRNSKSMKGIAFIAMVMAMVMFGAMAVPTEKTEAGLLNLGGSGSSSTLLGGSLLSPAIQPVAGLLDPVLNLIGSNGLVGGVVNSVNDLVQNALVYTVNVGAITGPVLATVGNTLNALDPITRPIVNDTVLPVARSLTQTTLVPLLQPVGKVVGQVADLVVEDLVFGTVNGLIKGVNEIAGGEVKALIPMPLDPSRSCEDCHHSRANLIAAMVDPANNARYPGLAGDVPFVDNFYVDPGYTTLPDSMMSSAVKHPLWEGCQTCHGSGDTFDPFPSDNWVPDSNPNDGKEVSMAWGNTNDSSHSCGKCHPANAHAFNKGMMGTFRGHDWAFNYNSGEIESTNPESNFFFDPLGSYHAGTDMERMPEDRNGKKVYAGYFQERRSCSSCHVGCADCHMNGPGNHPIGILGEVDILKGTRGVEICDVDQKNVAVGLRVEAYEQTVLRRGGVTLLEMRKGYIPGVSRGTPYTIYEAGMDVTTHRIHRPVTAATAAGANIGRTETRANLTQLQSIEFCWRCHFRTGAEYVGNFINIIPNPNYDKKTLGHLQAGMTCVDCHRWGQVHGSQSENSQSFQGTHEAPDNPSHPGGNPVGTVPKWPITPTPTKTTCGLCHTKEGKELGPTGGLGWGNLVTASYQQTAKLVKGLDYMVVPGKQSSMSHANMRCEVCHTQAQQQCWNCHVEESNTVTSLPLLGTNDVNIDLDLPFGVGPINGPIINVREAEGEPVLTDEQNARLMELPAENDAAHISVVLTFPQSKNEFNKALKYMGRNNFGQLTSMVHCPGPPRGIKTPPKYPQPLNKDGGQIIPKSGNYGEEGAVSDITTSAEGAWFMEPGHSIARNPDGFGYNACYNCHADTVRLGQEPITYFRKQPWVMNTVGAPEAILPGSHLANNTGMIKSGSSWNCNCHGPAMVHNGTFDGPWPLHNTPEDEYVNDPEPGNCGNGATLYAQNCAICHGSLDSSAKRNRTEEQIEAALSTQAAMMNINLTDAEVAEIACALSDQSTPPVIDGAALYTNNCSACHGPLASSVKTGATYTRIKWALSNTNVTGMSAPNLQALTDDEIHAIAHALGGE